MLKKILAVSIGALVLTGCESAKIEQESYYTEPEINGVSETSFESLDEVFTSEKGYTGTTEEDAKARILGKANIDLNIEELKEDGVDVSALNETTIQFAYDSYELTEEAKEKILKHITLLKNVNELKVILEGHTDKRGDRAYNLKLGEKRALAVKAFVIEQGIDTDKVETISFGEEKLLSNGNNNEDHSSNRRAEFVYQ
ncbi:OmpA family protein [Vibrio crassostreae]|uniref:OmpA family protein n=1 Tax=Vibrio crassostreae TaxID=246167 RepID=UPI001B307728|nr:OmpA family protein [Vibrio crassostreae]